MLDRHAVPGSLVAVLKMQPLAVGPMTEDNRIAAVLDGAEHVATQHEAIVHRNWHVPVDAHAVADFAHLREAHGPLASRTSLRGDGPDQAFGMIGNSAWACRSGPACSVTSQPNTAGGRSRGSSWVNGPTPVHTLPSVSTPGPGSPG